MNRQELIAKCRKDAVGGVKNRCETYSADIRDLLDLLVPYADKLESALAVSDLWEIRRKLADIMESAADL